MKQRRTPTLRMRNKPGFSPTSNAAIGTGVHTLTGKRYASRYPYAALTDIGRKRTINEDSVIAIPPLFAVADGLGGHDAGEVASSIAVEVLREHAPRKADLPALVRAVRAANDAVIQGAETGVGRAGMGCTMTAVMVDKTKAAIAQVGDSRAYMLRDGRLIQLTDDHSVVGAMVRSGHITLEEARNHPQRSVITRALGSDPDVLVDGFEVSLLGNDRILVCSDGLTAMVDDGHIAEILMNNEDAGTVAQNLIEAANNAGGNDNISVIVIDITTDHMQSAEPKTSKRIWLWGAVWAASVLAIFGALFWGTLSYANSRAHLDITPRGTIAIYQGIPGKFLGASLSTLHSDTGVSVTNLTAADQALIQDEIIYQSLEAAQSAVEDMVSHSTVTPESTDF